MRQMGVVAMLLVVALVIPAMAFAQASPTGAWCGGAHGPEGTNFGECPRAHGSHQVAGPASGYSGLERQDMNSDVSRDRSRQTEQAGGDSGGDAGAP